MASNSSSYLEAIQSIPGKIPGEKYRELNRIAKKIASTVKSQGDTIAPSTIYIPEVPEPLRSLVRLEIANLLQDYNGVIEALKSEDCTLVDRAMRMTWFFRGTNKDIVSVDYFDEHILPYASLNTRFKLIKTLAMNLKTSNETDLGETFYTYFALRYGRNNAEPLLVACGESFIYETAQKNKLALSYRVLKNLFAKYPQMIIRYLKLSKPNEDPWSRNIRQLNLRDYVNFLPRLIKKHLNAFIELLEMHDSTFEIELSNKATETFLKSNVDALLNKPKLYTKMMPLKVVAAKLTKAQYKSMIPKVLPENLKDFSYRSISPYLEHYPESERLSLAIDSYREKYNANLLNNHDAIGVEFLQMLPLEERTRQARVKLQKEPDWKERRWNIEKAWRCYLPIDESIGSIKTEITKTSSPDDRSCLLSQMFYSCKINDDKEALLGALRYFTTRHRNEEPYVIFEVLDNLVKYFDLSTVDSSHWEIINDFIRFLHVKDELNNHPTTSIKLLSAGVHFELIHDLSIDNKIEIILEIKMKEWDPSWSVLEKYPEYDRRCYELMLPMIPKKYPRFLDRRRPWKKGRVTIISGILSSIYSFNTRIGKATCLKMSIKNFSWLMDDVKDIVQSRKDSSSECDYNIRKIITNLRINEPDLYEAWIVVDADVLADVETREILDRLVKEPQDILEKWEQYFKEAKGHVSCSTFTQRFVKATRWYQDIPIKFLDQCLKELNGNDNANNSILILGILMEGSEFAGVIEPMLPQVSSIDIEHPDAKDSYKVIDAIPRAMNFANPPVPLNLVLRFCDGDYLNLGLVALTNACRRSSVAKVETIARNLVDRRVSVRKHGIRLFCLVASIDDLRKFLSDLWKTEKHRSIRAVIFAKIYDLFVSEYNPQTWKIMKDCMNELKIDDDDNFDVLMKLASIPDEYIADYVKQLFLTIEKLEAGGFDAARLFKYVIRVLGEIDGAISNLLPEEYCKQLLEKYFCNPCLDVTVNEAGNRYALYGYLIPGETRLESRLKIFSDLFENILRENWDVQHPKCSTFYPINYLARSFVDGLISVKEICAKVEIMEAVLKTFLKVLKPEQDFVSYALLTFGVAFKNVKTTWDVLDRIVETIPTLVEILTSEMSVELADVVTRWINFYTSNDQVDDFTYGVIESLCKAANKDSCILAAKLLFRSEKRELDDRRNKIVEMLREAPHPAVRCLVYRHVNSCDFIN